MKQLGNVVVLLLLAGCSRPGTERITVGGKQYCVPSNRVIHAPPWVPSGGNIKDEGLALRGCYWEEPADECRTLKSVGSLSITPKSAHAFTRYDALQPNAFYRSITREADTRTRLVGNGLLELSNKRLSWLTFYWRLNEPQPNRTMLPLAGDVLMFTCEANGATHSCTRTFNTDGLSVNYQFGTPNPVHFDVLAQDREIVADLSALACGAV